MVTFEHLYHRSKYRLYAYILFCFITNLVLHKNDHKVSVLCVLNKKKKLNFF